MDYNLCYVHHLYKAIYICTLIKYQHLLRCTLCFRNVNWLMDVFKYDIPSLNYNSYLWVFESFGVIVHHLKSYFASIFGIQIGSFLDCASNTDLALDNLFIWILTPSQKRFFEHQTPFQISICIQSSMCFDPMLGQHHS